MGRRNKRVKCNRNFPWINHSPLPRGDNCHFKWEHSGSNITWAATEQKIAIQAGEGRNYYENCKEANGETIVHYNGRIINAPEKAINRVS